MTAIRLHRAGRIATVTIDRPPLNILDLDALAELRAAVGSLAGDGDLSVVVIRGAGERAFSAGVAIADHTPEKVPAMLDRLHGTIRALADLPAVSIAAVAGHCLGGGMELAVACDLVVAERGARFAQPEVELGCFPPVAAALYPARIGPGRTLDLLLTGRELDAEEAHRLGLVTRLAAAGQLGADVERLAGELAAKSAPVLRLIKRAVRDGRDLPFRDALAAAERTYLEELCATADVAEGVAAFLEKRRPIWRHE